MRVVVTHPIPPPAVEVLQERGFDVVVGADDGANLHELVAGVDGILALLVDPVDGALLDAAGPQLKVVSNFAVGYDNIDLEACAARGVKVGHTPGVLTGAVAELTIALLLAVARRLVAADGAVRQAGYVSWGFSPFAGVELRGRTLGVIGAGRIGSAVARIARDGLGMDVVYTSRSVKAGVGRPLELDDLLREADAVTLHVPLTGETHHLLGARELALMKPAAILVNVSRGPVVDEHALAEALRSETIGGAALDVYEFEPRPLPELLELENVVLAPHIGSATEETRAAMSRLAAENVIAVLEGREMPAEVKPD